MELCWYKTSWTSGCLWLDNMQQTLIGDLFFFSPPWEAWKKNRKAAYFASSIYHPPRIGHWNPPQHRLNSAPFILHTTSSDWWDESCWSQELTSWEQQVSNSGTPPVPEALSGSWARSYMLALYRQNVTQTCPLSSSFVVLFTFIFSWYFL